MATAFALIHHEDDVFGISFPDFHGCIATGRTEDEVLRRGSEALNFHVAGMVEDGETIAEPRGLTQLRADKHFVADAKGAIVAIVSFDLPGRAVRLNISLEERLLESVDRAATAAGQSRSGFLAEAARRHLRAAS